MRHITRASSTPILPNTVLTQSQLVMAKTGFKPTTMVGYLVWLLAVVLAAQVPTAPDGSDRPTAVVSKVGADALVECTDLTDNCSGSVGSVRSCADL